MIIVRTCSELKEAALAATIGFFDGVHRGHRFLIEELKREATQRHLPSAVITFSKHPRAVLHTDYQPQLLNTFEEKMEQLATTGVDYCIVLDFTVELSRLTAREFIHYVLAEQWHIQTLLIGYDHRFGHDRTEGFEQYVGYGKEIGMEVIRAKACYDAEEAISSSAIRKLLQAGQVEKAAEMLTYPYRLAGHIVRGFQVGRKLGFPTANIQVDYPEKLIPGCGVYAVRVEVERQQHIGMLCIGNRPTVGNGEAISLEVNIFNFSGNIYNDAIRVTFMHFLRENIKFDSLEALREQLIKDREHVLQFIKE